LSDDLAKITFKASKQEGKEDSHSLKYTMNLNSRHMRTDVLNKEFEASYNEISDMKEKYKVALKKEVFMKFFSILKLPGSCVIKISHNSLIEMDYSLEKCAFINVLLETPARNI
jgi:hypothetical protein